nr:zinc finger, CCHC-type [Tanacetum cinerariifolium]
MEFVCLLVRTRPRREKSREFSCVDVLEMHDTLKLEDVLATLNSRELQKITEAKGDGGEGLYVRGRYRTGNEEQVSGSGADEYDNVDVMMVMSVDELVDWIMRNAMYEGRVRRNLISLGTLEKEGFTIKIQSGKNKVIKGLLVVLSGTRRANFIYTLDGQAVTRKTLKGRKQLGEYQTGWKIKMDNVLDFCNQRYTQQCSCDVSWKKTEEYTKIWSLKYTLRHPELKWNKVQVFKLIGKQVRRK